MATPSLLKPYHRTVAVFILLFGAGLTFLLWQNAARKERERIRSGFLSRAQTQATVSEQRLRSYQEMVYSLRDTFIGQEEVTSQEFNRVSGSILKRYSGVQALEWVRIVPGDQRAAFEQFLSAEADRPVVIVRRQADGTSRSAPPDHEYFVITYVEPVAGNEVVVGYDVLSAPTGPLCQEARQDHKFKASAPLRLFQAKGPEDEPGVIFLLPFWRTGPAGDGPVEGFVQGVFHVRSMLAQAHHLLTTSEALDTYYVDVPATGEPRLLYANLGGVEAATNTSRIPLPELDDPADFHQTLFIGGRQWLMVMKPNADWVRRVHTRQAATILASGLAITLLVALFVSTLLQRTRRIEQLVAERTRELHATESRLQGIVDHCPSIIFLKDLEGRHLLCNEPFAHLCNLPRHQILGRTDHELFAREQADAFRASDRQVLEAGEPIQFEQVAETPGGRRTVIVQKFPLRDETGRIYALCGIATDITERKAEEERKLILERQLLEGQKLESLGVLAGGIAHDFNNILTAILGNANLAALDLPKNHPIRPQLQQIEIASRRASDLCAQMLAYAGKAAFIITPVNLTALVHDTTALLDATVGRRVRIDLQTAAHLPAVSGDATQLRQIVMNLVINAADAIGDKSDGMIVVRTYARQLTPEIFASAVQSPQLAAGTYVALEVSDNGGGMSPEVQKRIFEPFFTTKFSGRGLGLAAVVGIVQGHRGALFVESIPGQGTTFRLFLPASTAPATHPSPPAAAPPAALTGTVLLVDDESAVRQVASKALRATGTQVVEAGDGVAALLAFRLQPEAIDVVLLDLTMPGISGEETLRQLRELAPDLPVVVMSGYSEAETMGRCANLGVSGFLAKPFEVEELLRRLAPHLA